jgi:hypothetical protein
VLCTNGHALPGGKVTPKFCPICGVSVTETCENGHPLAAGALACPICASSAGSHKGTPSKGDELPGLSTAPPSLVIGVPEASSRPPSSRNPAWLWGLVVLVVALVAGGILVGFHLGHSAPKPATTSATVIPARHPQTSGDSTGTSGDPGSSNTSGTTGDTGNSGGTTATTPAAGLAPVDTSAVTGQPYVSAIALTFETYFGGIDSQNWDLAYSAYSPQYQSNNSESSFESTHTTTSDTQAAITSISPGPFGTTEVGVSFQSTQSPADGPVQGESCTNWTLTYTLVPETAGSLSFLINSAALIGPGHTGCPGQP